MPRKRSGGFTLLEILIVLTVVAVVIGVGLPRFQSIFDVQIKSAIRKLVGTIRFTFYESAIRKSYYRLNYDLDEQKYYVTRLAVTGEFLQEESSIIKEEQLPAGIYFVDVDTVHAEKTDKGIAFTQFFPNGFAEQTVIHLRDDYDAQYTLLIQPLTGRVKVFDKYIDIVEGEAQ